MHKHVKRALLALAAALACALAAGPAAASAIEVDPGGNASAEASDLVLLSEGGLINPARTCDVELDVTFETSITVSIGSRAGVVNAVTFLNCSGGGMAAVMDGPWPLTFRSIILVTTPKVLRLRMEDVHLAIDSPIDCRYGGYVELRFYLYGPPLVSNAFASDPALTLTDIGGDPFCPPNAGLDFEGSMTTQGFVL
jgi:hypothetical protein